jgi:hypothetical protein
MSDDREVRGGPGGELLGTETHYSFRLPTKLSSNAHLEPEHVDGGLRLGVRCRRNLLLAVHGIDPPTLLGRFTGDALRLQGEVIVAPREDQRSAWVRAGRPAAEYRYPVVADSKAPLPLWCPNHKGGHAVDPARLRGELARADRAPSRDAWCKVRDVETTPGPRA